MKFTAERLFEIAMEEEKAAGVESTIEEQQLGIGNWAYYSADQEYKDEEEVREEIRDLIAADKERLAQKEEERAKEEEYKEFLERYEKKFEEEEEEEEN